ncbi:MAG: tryptophan-rich sensory protein [Clostridia bacterium]|nr:tryptophan-rich sensory protein [Clostridia bacterium]
MDREVFDLKINKKLLIICIVIPLAVGGLAALITGGGMDTFETLNKPPLSPPGWLFPVVWTILYILMGIASYLVLTSGKHPENIRAAITVYGIQLAFNFIWPLLFFGLSAYLFSFVWLTALWLLIFATIALFHRISETAGWLMIPYLIWVTFAGYLNLGIYFLN